jgi:hypothetical protein
MLPLFFSAMAATETLDFWTLSIVQNSNQLENTTFQKLDLFPSSGEVRETPILLGPLERANLNHWINRVDVSLPSPEDGNKSSFRNIMFSSY